MNCSTEPSTHASPTLRLSCASVRRGVNAALDQAIAALLTDRLLDPALLANLHFRATPNWPTAYRPTSGSTHWPSLTPATMCCVRWLSVTQRSSRRYGHERAVPARYAWAQGCSTGGAPRAESNTLLALANLVPDADARNFCLAQANAADNLTDALGDGVYADRPARGAR